MVNYNITIEELKETLAQPRYKTHVYNKKNRIPAFEKLNFYGDTSTVFDDLFGKLGRVPSQQEYIEEGTRRAKEFFETDVDSDGKKMIANFNYNGGGYDVTYFKWGEKLKKAVQYRLSRSYPSYLVEYSTIVQLKNMYPNMLIATHNYLDLVFGVDIVCADRESRKVFYVHVTTNTEGAKRMIHVKGNKTGYLINRQGKKVWWKRTFDDAHINMVFDNEESWITDYINGNPIMKEEYIRWEVEEALKSDLDSFINNVQFNGFHKWLVKNDINDDGCKSFFV